MAARQHRFSVFRFLPLRWTGFTALAIGLLVSFFGRLLPPNPLQAEPPPTPPALARILESTWQGYKHTFIQADGRVIDRQAADISTSEGQGYAMLRAVWMNDPETFNRVYQWSIQNLKVRGDQLFAWKWGRRTEAFWRLHPNEPQQQTWGLLDHHSASDANQDIALALILAAQQWKQPQYQQQAQALLNAMWDKETLSTPVGRVLLPGDWRYSSQPNSVRINPSYWAPYAYRVFAQVDSTHPWMELVESSYLLLDRLQQQASHPLVPDWAELSLVDGQLHPCQDSPSANDFGNEAVRLLWRLELDRLLNPGERRANRTLQRLYQPIGQAYQQHQQWPGKLSLQQSSSQFAPMETRATAGILLPSALRFQPKVGGRLLREVLGWQSVNQPGLWEPTTDYYAQNWLWFGLWLANAQQNGTGGIERLPVLERLPHLANQAKRLPPSRTTP
ncbi:MAG: glycosyl hydrolase family 8 [Candidatus Melainabacteria bacterium]|nr:glycosyl hydrolase family 8 [Candidatus Melainabacteria bacterium]